MLCEHCKNPREASAPVVCLIVWAEALPRPYVIGTSPESNLTVCLADGCDDCVRFAARAVAGNQLLAAKVGTDWQMIHVVFADGNAARMAASAAKDAVPQ